MNTELIGPRFGHFKSEELEPGPFSWSQITKTINMKHLNYINLTNGTEWRFGNSG